MSAGKGDTPRPVNGEKYRNNYDKIFKKESPEVREAGVIGWVCENKPIREVIVSDEKGATILNLKDLDKLNFK